MSEALVLTFPHTLERALARQRLDAGLARLPIPGGGAVQVQWPEPHAATAEVLVMGQKLVLALQVLDEAVVVRVTVPPVLATRQDVIEAFLGGGVRQMLAQAAPAPAAADPQDEITPQVNVAPEVRRVHEEAIVIDAVCPLATEGQYLDRYRRGGVTVVTPTIAAGPEDARTTFKRLAMWHGLFQARSDLLQVRSAADIRAAKQSKRLGVLLAFQGTDAIEDDIDLIDAYHALGVRMIQLAYNAPCRAGSGCEVPEDAGLTGFGRAIVARLNARKIVVDCSHTGWRTSRDAIETSSAPVVFSHANPAAVHPIRRNIPDDLIRAAAATGGVIGVTGYPSFVGKAARPSIDDLLAHVSHIADLVGVDHVGLGLDYFTGQHGVMPLAEARATYDFMIQSGIWTADNYAPPPYWYPEGIEIPDTLPNLTDALLRRGFSEEETRKILGGNWLRVFEAVWGG